MNGEILNISPFVIWVIAGSQVLNFGLMVWNLFASAGRANVKRLDDHAARLQGHGDRIAALEMAQREGPSRNDFHQLDLGMTELKGAMAVLTERLKPVEAISDRLQEVLIDQGRRS